VHREIHLGLLKVVHCTLEPRQRITIVARDAVEAEAVRNVGMLQRQGEGKHLGFLLLLFPRNNEASR
jgi:hypothetical protein